MDAILNLISYLGTPMAVFLLLCITFFLVVIKLYGSDFIPIFMHKRNRFHSAVWAAIALITAGSVLIPKMTENSQFLKEEHWIATLNVSFSTYECIQIVMIVIFVLYSVNNIEHCRGASFPVRQYLKYCENKICEGAFFEIRGKVLSMPWYCIWKTDKNAYFLLLGRYYLGASCPADAIQALRRVKTDPLYKEEFERYCIRLSAAYVEVGAYAKASSMLEQLEQADEEKDCEQDPKYWNLKCMIEDSKGNLQAALDCARRGLDAAEENDHSMKCRLNNNISRLLLLRQDTQNALYQMRWAKKHLDQMEKPNMFLDNVVYGNLILMLVYWLDDI